MTCAIFLMRNTVPFSRNISILADSSKLSGTGIFASMKQMFFVSLRVSTSDFIPFSLINQAQNVDIWISYSRQNSVGVRLFDLNNANNLCRSSAPRNKWPRLSFLIFSVFMPQASHTNGGLYRGWIIRRLRKRG